LKNMTYHRVVGWRHADTNLVTRRHAIHPKLMKVLMAIDGRDQERDKNRGGKHIYKKSERKIVMELFSGIQ
jgi:hypothetical protein